MAKYCLNFDSYVKRLSSFVQIIIISFTLSIHFFGCLPLLLVPSTCPYSATTGSLFPSILVTCPNHVSLLFLILSTNVPCCPSSFLVISFRILSLLDLPSILRSQLISATSIVKKNNIRERTRAVQLRLTAATNGAYPPFIFFSQAPALGPVHHHRDDKCSV